MRKNFFRTAALATVLSMALLFAGCGSKESDKKESDTKQESTSEDEAEDDDTDTAEIYNSVEDYVNSSELQEQLDNLKSSLEGSGMKIEIKAEGNAIVYSYQYESLARADFDENSIDTLNSGLEEQASTFQLVAKSLKEATKEENPVVKIQYISSDGEILVEKEFAAE